MTLNDYINEALLRVPTAITLPQATIISAVNDARSELSLITNPALTITGVPLVAGQMSYAYPTSSTYTVTGIKRIWVYLGTERYEIKRRPMGKYEISGLQAYPAYYYIENGSVYFYPVPSSDYETDWEVSSIPNPLVNTTDTESYIPAPYIYALNFLIAAYVSIYDTKVQLSQAYRQMYQNFLGSLNKGDM